MIPNSYMSSRWQGKVTPILRDSKENDVTLMSLSKPQFHAAIVELVNGGLWPEIGSFWQEWLKMILCSEDGETFVQFDETHHHFLFLDLAEVERQLAALFLVSHLPEFSDLSFQLSYFCQQHSQHFFVCFLVHCYCFGFSAATPRAAGQASAKHGAGQ